MAFFFLFLLTESLLENLSAVHHVAPNGFANPFTWTARSCSKHWEDPTGALWSDFSKTDQDLLKTVVQAPLLQPKFWLRLHAWDLIRAVWLSVKAGLGQKGDLQNGPLLTSCDWRGSTLGYCTKTLQSLRYPLCVLWTRKQFVRGTLHKPLKTQTLRNEVWIRLCARQ